MKLWKTNSIILVILLAAASGLFLSCNQTKKQNGENESRVVYNIKSSQEFDQAVSNAGEKLIIVDLYADWCGPCRILSPMIEKIAERYKEKALFFKVNVDEQKEIAAVFRVTGIPYVVFIRDKKIVDTLMGVYPEEKYIELINKNSQIK